VISADEKARPANSPAPRAGGASGAKVSWEVKAVRNDRWVRQNGAPVEPEKPAQEKGAYQRPELYGATSTRLPDNHPNHPLATQHAAQKDPV
jgi:hypothetical protein